MSEVEGFSSEDIERHLCAYQCGRPFLYILGSLEDGSMEQLCLPCFAASAASIIKAVADSGLMDIGDMMVQGTAEPDVGYEGVALNVLLDNVNRVVSADDPLESAASFYTEDVAG